MLVALEIWLSWLGAAYAFVLLAVLLWGIRQSLLRPEGPRSGPIARLLRTPIFYLVTTALFLAFCYIFWRLLPLALSTAGRWFSLVAGALCLFPGLTLALWGRLALGRYYNVSSVLAVHIAADHRLVTRGPFGIMRHPMYLGLILAAAGALLIYRTWTTLFLGLMAATLVLRARKEEELLSRVHGAEWLAYKARVPAWLPGWPGKRPPPPAPE